MPTLKKNSTKSTTLLKKEIQLNQVTSCELPLTKAHL